MKETRRLKERTQSCVCFQRHIVYWVYDLLPPITAHEKEREDHKRPQNDCQNHKARIPLSLWKSIHIYICSFRSLKISLFQWLHASLELRWVSVVQICSIIGPSKRRVAKEWFVLTVSKPKFKRLISMVDQRSLKWSVSELERWPRKCISWVGWVHLIFIREFSVRVHVHNFSNIFHKT